MKLKIRGVDCMRFLFFLQVHPKDLVNGIINATFLLLFKDLIKLYACYNDGIINLLGKNFIISLLEIKTL